jgi:hypothetical protein
VELLQPTLDLNLTDYTPVKTNLTGNYTFASSDVLAVLSKNWVSAFMKMYVLKSPVQCQKISGCSVSPLDSIYLYFLNAITTVSPLELC